MTPHPLVHLEVVVDVSHEGERGGEGDGPEHQEEDVAGKEGVAKELDGLQRAVHVRAVVVVEQSVDKHKQTRGPVQGGNEGRGKQPAILQQTHIHVYTYTTSVPSH